MAKIYINEFILGHNVDTLVMVKRKQLAKIPNGPGCYLSITCMDKTGEIEGRIWENPQELSSKIQDRDILSIKGVVTEYKGKALIKVDEVTKVDDNLCDLADFLPCTSKNRREMFEELIQVMSSIRNPYLRRLLKEFLSDPDWLKEFTSAPAEKRSHQPYIGGLLEHTMNVVNICLKFTEMYKFLDYDLLLTGAILHDIGKIQEFDYRRTIDYSTAGRLLGHIILGVQLVEEKLKVITDFPQELRIALLHLIVSHHGEHEGQSPKKPKFLEAMLLHFADRLDTEVYQFEYLRNGQEDNKQNLVFLEDFDENFSSLKRERGIL